jgi:hypothetical protein
MTASRFGQFIMPGTVGSNIVAASATTPVESVEYICGNNTAGQGYAGSAMIRIYNSATAPAAACVGTLWGRSGTGDIWHPIGSVYGNLTAGSGTSGSASTPGNLTGANSGGAGAALPIATTGALVAGLVEQPIAFGPEWARLLVSFIGNTTGSCTVDAWINEFETL